METFEEIPTRSPANIKNTELRPPCCRGHEKPSSGTQFRASAAPKPPKLSADGSRQPTLQTSPPPHHKGTGKEKGKGKGRGGRAGKGIR